MHACIHCNTLQYIALHCITLHYITLHYITLHYIHTYLYHVYVHMHSDPWPPRLSAIIHEAKLWPRLILTFVKSYRLNIQKSSNFDGNKGACKLATLNQGASHILPPLIAKTEFIGTVCLWRFWCCCSCHLLPILEVFLGATVDLNSATSATNMCFRQALYVLCVHFHQS